MELEELLDKCTNKGTQVYLAGDININLNKSTTESRDYTESLTSLGFSFYINRPTRICRRQGDDYTTFTTLDHFVSNANPDCIQSGILTYDISDHLPVFALINIGRPDLHKEQLLYRRIFKPSLQNKFVEHLDSLLNKLEFDECSPDTNMEKITNTVQLAIDHIFPLKKYSKKDTKAALYPWITNKLDKDDEELDKLYTQHIKNGIINSEEHIKYKKARNKLNRDIGKVLR